MIKLREFRYILYQLLRPFSYLKIKHNDKWIYDWLFPVVCTAITCIYIKFNIPISDVTDVNGLISKITDFIGNLPGFFIAALAAVATFNKDDIDELMSNPPKIPIFVAGEMTMIEMTRRRFLCVLFSYLTAVSIFLVLITRIFLATKINSNIEIYISWVGAIVYFFILWQMLLATILGLYYLGERLHTPQ